MIFDLENFEPLLLNPLPVYWARKRRRQPRFAIALRCIQLGLNEEDTCGEVGPSQIGVSEVGPGEVGHAQIGSPQVGSNEVGPSQVGSSQVRAFEPGSDEVGSPVVLLMLEVCAHEFACAEQQGIDLLPVPGHVQFQEGGGAAVGEAFGLVQGEVELVAERTGGLQHHGFGQVPEQLMEVAHDLEDGEHLLCGSWVLPPVLPAEGDLGDLLTRAEAVVYGAAAKALLPEVCVDAAAEVGL